MPEIDLETLSEDEINHDGILKTYEVSTIYQQLVWLQQISQEVLKKIHILLGWHALSDVEQVLGMLQPVPPLSVVLNFAQALAVLDCSNVRCKTGLCCAVLIPSKQTRHNGSVFLQLKSVHDMTPCIEYCTYITTVYCIHMYSKCSDIQYSVSWQTRRKCCSEYAAISTRWKNLSSFFFSMLKARV